MSSNFRLRMNRKAIDRQVNRCRRAMIYEPETPQIITIVRNTGGWITPILETTSPPTLVYASAWIIIIEKAVNGLSSVPFIPLWGLSVLTSRHKSDKP